MSTSLLDHAFGIRGDPYVRTNGQGGQRVFTIRQEPRTRRGSAYFRSWGRVKRRSRAVPVGRKPTTVILPTRRMLVSESRSPGRSPLRRPTAKLDLRLRAPWGGLSRSMTILDVARRLGVGWDLIKDIQKRDLSRRFAKPKVKHLKSIAIDEIAVTMGPRYLTIVMDSESGVVDFVGDAEGPRP